MMNNNWLKYLVALAAVMIAGSAAYFSVTGLGVLFSGASIAVMVMAGSLEYAKLVTATYLKQRWEDIQGFNKWYLTGAVVILMAITSAGIFGYLSNAFQQQNIKLDQIQREISVWDTKIKSNNEQIASLSTQLTSLQSNQGTILEKGKVNSRLLRSVDNRDKQSTKLSDKISRLQDENVQYNEEINKIKNNNIDIEKEVGGFRFVAEAFGVELKSVVKFFIFLIVIVFDPLAIALVIAFNSLVIGKKKEEEIVTKIEEDPALLKDFVDETTRLHLSEEDLKKLEEVLLNPPAPNEELKKAADEYNKKWNGISQEVWDRMEEIEKQREAIHGPITDEDVPTGALANSEYRERGEILAEMMQNDQELGLYDEPFDNPMIKDEEPYAGPPSSIFPEEVEYTDEYSKPLYENPIPTPLESTPQPEADFGIVAEVVPSLSDEEIMEMNQDEYERKLDTDDDVTDWDITLMDGLENEEPPTIEEENQNFTELTQNDEFISEAIEEFNRESILDGDWEILDSEWTPELEENEPVYQSDNKEMDESLEIINNVLEEPQIEVFRATNTDDWSTPPPIEETEEVIEESPQDEEELKKKF